MIAHTKLEDVRAIGHANMVPADQVLLEDMLATIEDPDEVLGTYARTLFVEDRPIAVVGAWPLWPGVSRAWAIFTDDVKAKPLALFKLAKGQLEYVVARDDLHRLEAVVLSGHTAGQRLVRHLGFEREGRLRKFGPAEEDYHLFSKVK